MNKEEFIAAIRFLVWKGYQQGAGQPYNAQINDDQYKSLLNGVKFRLENPDATPEENHMNWINCKLGQGWVWGSKKDLKAKKHPDLVEYEQLPEVEKMKNEVSIMAHDEAVKLWKELKTFRVKDYDGKPILVEGDCDICGLGPYPIEKIEQAQKDNPDCIIAPFEGTFCECSMAVKAIYKILKEIKERQMSVVGELED